MQLGNRIICNQHGEILSQSGEIEGAVLSRPSVDTTHVIDLEFGEINYRTHYISHIDMDTMRPVVVAKPIRETAEQKHIRELEDTLLLQMDAEIGGIL